MDHILTGKFPTNILKIFKLADNGTVEETVTGEERRPGHLAGNYVKCSCGEKWHGIYAEEKAKKHLYRKGEPGTSATTG